MPSRAAFAAVPLALLACASPRATTAPPTAAAARARFAPEDGDLVFEQAVRAAALAGYRLRTCDPEERRFETEQIEFDAPCRASTCLARQFVEVKLGYRVARVTVERELYDGGYRAWQDEEARASEAAARALLARIFADLAPRRAAADPCAAAARLEVSALGAATATR